MQKANSPSVVVAGLLALVRALLVFIGGTFAVHRLALRFSGDVIGDSAEIEPYFSWLGDAILPDSTATEALGNTMLLGSAAILIGLVVGAVFGALLRIRGIGAGIGFLAIPAMAIFIPGIVLYPLARFAVDQDLVPTQALTDGQPLGESLRFIGFWGLLVGLAMAPIVAAVTAGPARGRLFGLDTILASLAARTDPSPSWRFGLPLSVFGLTMASAEILSGHEGVFGRFNRSLQGGDVGLALDLAVMAVLAAALAALAVDLISLATADDRDSSSTGRRADYVGGVGQRSSPLGRIEVSRLLPGLFALLVIVAGVAGAGFSVDPAATSEPLEFSAGATFGGPWLGTDEIGRSVMALTAAALAPAMIAALIPGLVAVALGLIIAMLGHAAPRPVERIVGVAIDGLWWPLPVLVPLVSVFGLSDDGPTELKIAALGLTGAMIAPLASRLIGRAVMPASSGRTLRLVAAWLYCAALALSAYLVAGFMGFHGEDTTADLGRLLAEGIGGYDAGHWALFGPSMATVVLTGLLLSLSAAVAVPADKPGLALPPQAVLAQEVRDTPRSKILESDAAALDDWFGPLDGHDGEPEVSEPITTSPPIATPPPMPSPALASTPADSEASEPVSQPPMPDDGFMLSAEPPSAADEDNPAPDPAKDIDDDIGQGVDEAAGHEPQLTDPDDSTDRADEANDTDDAGPSVDADRTHDATNAANTDDADDAAVDGDTGAPAFDVETEASKTIELRPSTVRKVQARALAISDSPLREPAEQEASQPEPGDTKPVLATRRPVDRFKSQDPLPEDSSDR